MKIASAAIIAAALFVSPLSSSAQLFSDSHTETFDTYADQSAVSTNWLASVGGGLSLSTTHSVSSPNSVITIGSSGQIYRRIADPLPSSGLDFTFAFYDSGSSSVKDYGMLYDRTGTIWGSGTLNQILSLGRNTFSLDSANKYYAQVRFGTPALGNGATASSGGNGWIVLGGGPNVAAGWHTAEILGKPDLNNVGKMEFDFFINGTLAGSAGNLSPQTFDWAVLGSGVASTGGFMAFDNVNVVPEPSALALGLLGLGMTTLGLRRKRS
jgi:hypothetical protein